MLTLAGRASKRREKQANNFGWF